MRGLTFQIVYQLGAFGFRISLQCAMGCATDWLIPNAIDQLGRCSVGMHHIAKNDGNFFEPNSSIPLFSFKRSEKICSGIISSPVVVS
jgi:hypothetical protein